MPIETGKDKDGAFVRWGKHGKKYRYSPNDKASLDRAKEKASSQGRAAFANGYRPK
jgi:hypothetical protein